VIEAICWDVGGVFSGRPADAMASIAVEYDVDADEIFAAVFGPYHLDGDHHWHRLERGEISLKEAWGEVAAAVAAFGIELSLMDLFRRFGDDPHDRTVVIDAARDLHADGISMGIITNNIKEFSDGEDGGDWRKIVPMDLMSVVIDSSAVGMRKPDPAIYHHTLAELGVGAANTVFLDDMASNVDAAKAIGMHGIVVDGDPAPAMAELRALVDQLN
jgi:putative hydrolase of the HAD superfamily